MWGKQSSVKRRWQGRSSSNCIFVQRDKETRNQRFPRTQCTLNLFNHTRTIRQKTISTESVPGSLPIPFLIKEGMSWGPPFETKSLIAEDTINSVPSTRRSTDGWRVPSKISISGSERGVPVGFAPSYWLWSPSHHLLRFGVEGLIPPYRVTDTRHTPHESFYNPLSLFYLYIPTKF